MGARRLQAIGGGSTFAISLPKAWVLSSGLSAGDEVDVEPRGDGSVIVRPGVGASHPKRAVSMALAPASAQEAARTVIGLYVAGFDTAALTFPASSASATRAGVFAACEKLHGLQVVEESATRILLQDLSDASDLSPERGLRRMQLVALQMLAGAERIVRAGASESALSELQRQEGELDRLQTLLTKQHSVPSDAGDALLRGDRPADALAIMLVAQFVERIGDYAVRLSTSCGQLRDPSEAPHDVADALARSRALVDDALRSFNAAEASLANQVIDAALAFTRGLRPHRAPSATHRTGSCDSCFKRFDALESVSRIALYAKGIAEAAINRSLRARLDATPVSP